MAQTGLSFEYDDVRIEGDEAPNASSYKSAFVQQLSRLLSIDHGNKTRKPLPNEETKEDSLRQPGLVPLARSLVDSFSKLGLGSAATLFKVQEAALLEDYIDDRQYVMEHLIQAVVKDSNGLVGRRGTEAFVKTLWDDLEHPPDNYLAGEYRFRSADGSKNSPLHPQMGAAGQPYARSVKPLTTQSAVLPDPGVIFDCLLERREPKEHPAQVSSVLFYLATIIIHDLFRTDHRDFAYSKTSSYLDLAPLYGSSEKELATMRTFKDGKLHPDCFAETRLLMLPPGSGILLIMFNRFHNHVAEQLASINENGRFTKPKEDAKNEAWTEYDNEIFQTSRLITCGLYINIILIDYVRTILNLNRSDSDWQLNPRIEIPDGPAMGVGNQVSAEFNLVYRWHSTVSIKDEKWTQNAFAEIFGDRKPDDIPMTEFLTELGKIEMKFQSQTPLERQFGEFKRKPDGYYDDEQLVESITSSCDDCANAYGPRQVPAVLKAVEVLGIKQARSWNLATLNEFRKHFSLRPHETWEDITTDKEVAAHLKNLYKDVDNVELYPGLVVEDAKEPMAPGSGLCPSYTVSRAVLSDAVTLVRGDRFYTTSYHPRILTNWGYAEADYDKKVDHGCVIYKLFQRAFPNHFDPDSIYAHYPLTVAKAVKNDVLRHCLPHRAHLYDSNSVSLRGSSCPSIISTYSSLQQVLASPESYDLDIYIATRLLCPDKKGDLKFSAVVSSYLQKGPCSKISSVPNVLFSSLGSRFEMDLQQHIDEKSYKLRKFREVDIIRDVINKASARLVIDLFDIAHGADAIQCSEAELRDMFSIIASTWSNFDRTYLTRLRQKAAPAAKRLRDSMVPRLEDLAIKLSKNGDYLAKFKDKPLELLRLEILSGMFRAGLNNEQVFLATMVLASSLATSISQHSSELLETLIASENTFLVAIQRLVSEKTSKANDELSTYIRELIRVSSEAVSVRTVRQAATIKVDNQDPIVLTPGATILISARTINKDAAHFDKVDSFDVARKIACYLPLNLTIGTSNDPVWQEMHLAAIRSTMKVICALPGLRSAEMWNGTTSAKGMKRIPVRVGVPGRQQEQDGPVVQYAYMSEKWDTLSAFPTSLKVNWDL